MRGRRPPRALIAAACTLGVLLGPTAASALAQGLETLWVGQGGSVQAAVDRAGQDLRSGAASSALIEVAPGFYSGNVAIPALPATEPLTIQGAGPSTELGGLGAGSVVTVPAGSRVTITDLTIAGGRAVSGGGVNNAGDLTLLRDVVTLNTAIAPDPTVDGAGRGGGIFSSGWLTLQDSTVSHNQSNVGGGGLDVDGGILNAARDAIVGNSASPAGGRGGGVEINTPSFCCSLTDSTIAGNSANGSLPVAGVFVGIQSELRLYGDTIASNTAPNGVGGLLLFGGTVDIGGTLLAGNSAVECGLNLASFNANGGDLSDDHTCPVELIGVDPKLQPLASNGGPSQTMAINASSPAYGANPLCDGIDQRGVPRRQLGATRCDIGAYQVSAPSTYVANQAAGSVTAYATGATGDAAPTLTLAGAATGLSKPTGVLVDGSGKVYVANAGSNSITEYAPGVNGNATPITTIAGPLTQLSQPQDLALDSSGDLLVTNSNASITEYPPGASGNVAPKARIAGSNTKLSAPRGIVLDGAGALRVTNGNGTVTTYAAGAHGNVAPLSKLTINAGAGRPWGLNFDPSGNLVLADSAASRVDSFAATATRSAAPLSALSGAPPALNAPVGLDLDLAGDIFVANKASNSVSEYAPGSAGTAAPLATIAGADTGLSTPMFLSELPPPPPPRMRLATARRQSRRQIVRGGIALTVRASGTAAFRSRPITLTATARAKGRTIAAIRATPLRPGRVSLLLVPSRSAAHVLRGRHLAAITVVVTIRGGAGRQVRHLTVALTR